jgi:hypothetical protein
MVFDTVDLLSLTGYAEMRVTVFVRVTLGDAAKQRTVPQNGTESFHHFTSGPAGLVMIPHGVPGTSVHNVDRACTNLGLSLMPRWAVPVR